MNIADKLITIANNIPVVAKAVKNAKTKVNGTCIHVNDIINDNPSQPKLQLKTKNLFIVKDMCAPNNSLDTIYDEDTITTTFTSGTLYINKNRKVIYPAGTYTVSIVPVSENISCSIWLYDIDGVETFVKAFSLISTTMSQTVTSDKDFAIAFGGYGGANGAGYGTHSFKIQIEKGSYASAYTPYTDQFRIVGQSKNLFNVEDRTVRNFGATSNTTQRVFTENSVYLNVSANNYCVAGHKVSYNQIDDNSFTVLIPSTSQSGWSGYGAAFNFKVNPNTTYSVSARFDNEKGIINGCGFFDQDGNFISFAGRATNVTTPDNCVWMNVVFGVRLRDEEVLYEKVQLEIGSAATDYEPYGIIPLGVKVSSYGKNLFNKMKYATPTGTSSTKYYIDEDYITSFWGSGYEYMAVNITDIWYILEKLKGKKATFSFDLRADVAGQVLFYTLGKHLINFNYSTKNKFNATTEWQHCTTTVPINNNSVNLNGSGDANQCALSWYGTYDTGVKPYVRNLQIEISDIETEYEDYEEPQIVIAEETGEVFGLTFTRPYITLLAEDQVSIEMEYTSQATLEIYNKYQQIKTAELELLEKLKLK